MTPFEKAGYTKETRFKVLVDYAGVKKGAAAMLFRDDGSRHPRFITEDGVTVALYLPGEASIEELEVVNEEQPEAEKIEKPKIIQIVEAKRRILGLGSDGITYRISGGMWVEFVDGIYGSTK